MTDLIDGAKQKPLVHIENAEILAAVSANGVGAYLYLAGDVIDHPNPHLPEGTKVLTSKVENHDAAAGIFETQNSVYQLVR
jgi:hypothetical protein